MERKPSLRELKKKLGKDCRICDINGEKCLCLDLKNAYQIRISGCDPADRKEYASLFLLYVDPSHSMRVYSIRDIEINAEKISCAVNELRNFSLALIEYGGSSWDGLMKFLTSDG